MQGVEALGPTGRRPVELVRLLPLRRLGETRESARPRCVPALDLSGSGAGVAMGETSQPPIGGAAASSSPAAAPAPALASAELVAQQVAADIQSSPQMEETERVYRFGIGTGEGNGKGGKGRGGTVQAMALHAPASRPRDEGSTRRRSGLKTGVFYAIRLSLGGKSAERIGGASPPVGRPSRWRQPAPHWTFRPSSRHARDAQHRGMHVATTIGPSSKKSPGRSSGWGVWPIRCSSQTVSMCVCLPRLPRRSSPCPHQALGARHVEPEMWLHCALLLRLNSVFEGMAIFGTPAAGGYLWVASHSCDRLWLAGSRFVIASHVLCRAGLRLTLPALAAHSRAASPRAPGPAGTSSLRRAPCVLALPRLILSLFLVLG